MNAASFVKPLFATLLFLFCSGIAKSADITAIASGNWNNASTWQGGVPGSADDVTIPSGLTVTLTGNVSIKSLTINGVLDAVNYVVNINGNGAITINGMVKVRHSGGLYGGTVPSGTNYTLGTASTVDFYGGDYQQITVRDYANLIISGNRGGQFLNLAGTIGITGSFTHSATNVNYNNTGFTIQYKGNNQLVDASYPYYNVSLEGATGTTFPSGTISIKGVFNPGTITTATQGTVKYTGVNGQSVAAFNYFNLDMTSVATAAYPAGTVGIKGTFSPGNFQSASQGTICFGGSNQAVPAFGYYHLDLTGASGTSFSTSTNPFVDIAGTFTPGSITSATTGSTIRFKGAADQAIPAFNYHHLDLNNTSHSFPAGTVGIAGNLTNYTNNVATQGTINYNGINQQVPSFYYHNLGLVGATNPTLVTLGTILTFHVNGSFNPGAITSAGNNYTFEYSGTNQTVAAFNYYNLSLTGTGTQFTTGTVGILHAFSPGSITSANAGTISYLTNDNSVVNTGFTYNNLALSASGTYNLFGGTVLNMNGNFTVGSNTTLNFYNTTPSTFNIGGSVSYQAPGNNISGLTLNLTGTGNLLVSTGNMPNITIAGTASQTLSGNLTLPSGYVLTDNGTLNTGAFQVTGSGTINVGSTGVLGTANASGISAAIASTVTISPNSNIDYVFTESQSTGFSGRSITAVRSITVSNSSGDVQLDQAVVIGSNGYLKVNSGASFDAGSNSLTLGTGATVTINGTFKTSNTAGFSGGSNTAIRNTNSPVITIASGSTIAYTALSGQVVSGRSDYHHLSLANSEKTLEAASTLGGNILLSGDAKLLLGSSNLTIAGTMIGDASNFVVTSGAGSVILQGVGSAGKQFLVGATSSSFTPLTIRQASNLDWTVNVAGSIAPAIATSAESIQRTWTITPSINPAPSAATLTFQYNEGDAGILGGSWNSNGNVTFKRYNGTVWTSPTGNIAPTGTAGGIRTATASGFTQFSPWIVAQGGTVLPVRFVSFTGRKESAGNVLRWTTAQESNNAAFVLERSRDGRNFTALARIGSRATGGNSSTPIDYSFTDATILAGAWYYRLQQQDVTGATHYSAVLRLSEATGSLLEGGLYPSPATDKLQATLRSDRQQAAQLQILDVMGRVLQQRTLPLQEGTNAIQLELGQLPAGSYFLHIQLADGRSEQSRFQKR
ncbi:MAG: T9SS type A sorting domain-containing protein [Chitinophagaceae bacterium]|nr:MAG: T9SS type A sorting domain-containing protein [Chitinophagaceae bacterium]